jgi:serine/threonine protein kinase
MGQIDELDERSDIFSLGGILYAILTLRPPVEGSDTGGSAEQGRISRGDYLAV